MARQKMLEDTRLSKESLMAEAVAAIKATKVQHVVLKPNPVEHTAESQSDFLEDLRYILGF